MSLFVPVLLYIGKTHKKKQKSGCDNSHVRTHLFCTAEFLPKVRTERLFMEEEEKKEDGEKSSQVVFFYSDTLYDLHDSHSVPHPWGCNTYALSRVIH